MQRALHNWPGEPVQVEYRAFFLNPSIPPEGYDFIPYMQAKFNGRINMQDALEGPGRMGEAVGLTFNMHWITKAPNSLLSHCLIALAPEVVREAVIDEVYAAYFEHGQDIGDPETLIQIGVKHGFGESQLRAELNSPEIQAQVESQAQEAQRLGIRGVPYFIINGKYAFSGAQPPEAILSALRQVAERENGA